MSTPALSIPWPTVVAHEAVTKSDDTVLVDCHALFVGGAGTVVATVADVDVTYTVAAGAVLPIAATKVKAASTATGIVLWRYN